jgi:hypothetical protein
MGEARQSLPAGPRIHLSGILRFGSEIVERTFTYSEIPSRTSQGDFPLGWHVESARGVSPQASHGTVREPLGSYGSYRPAVGLNPRLQW